jgi:hypothetical protein
MARSVSTADKPVVVMMVPLSVILEEGVTTLGMSMLKSPGGLAVVRQVKHQSLEPQAD